MSHLSANRHKNRAKQEKKISVYAVEDNNDTARSNKYLITILYLCLAGKTKVE